jgi:hypothetical protein
VLDPNPARFVAAYMEEAARAAADAGRATPRFGPAFTALVQRLAALPTAAR